MLRSSRFVQHFSNISRKLIYTRPGPPPVIQQNGNPIKCYAVKAPQQQSLKEQIDRLSAIVRKGGYIELRDVEIIKGTISQTVTPTSFHAIELIRYCGKPLSHEAPEKRQKLLHGIVNQFNKSNMQLSVSHYNAMLSVYIENGYKFSPTDFLTEMEARNITANRVTYQNLISSCCRRGDIEEATNILQLMKSKQLPINVNILNDFIWGHVISNDIDSANEMIEIIKKNGLKPNAETFGNLLKGYAKMGDTAGIEKTFERFKEENIIVINEDILDAVCELAQNGHVEQAEPLIQLLRPSFNYSKSVKSGIDRLISDNQEKLIPKILATADERSRVELAKYSIIRLVRNKCSAERVETLWKSLESMGITIATHHDVYEAGLRSQSSELIQAILKERKSQELPILEEYFWSLLQLEGKKGPEHLVNLLQKMQQEYNVYPRFVTLRDNILTSFGCKNNPKLALARLRMTNIPISTALRATVDRCLLEGDIKSAWTVVSGHPAIYWNWKEFGKHLIYALKATKDVDHFIRLVRLLYESVPLEKEFSGKQKNEETDLLGQFIFETVSTLDKDKGSLSESILQGLLNQGLGISSNDCARIQNALGSEYTTKASDTLALLSNSVLRPQPLERGKTRSEVSLLPSNELVKLIQSETEKRRPVAILKKNLCLAYLREKNVEKAEEIMDQLEAQGRLTQANYTALISLYTTTDNLEKAMSTLDKIKSKNPEFILYSPKVADIVKLLLEKKSDMGEIKTFLSANRRPEANPRDEATLAALLYDIAEKGDAELLNETYTSLLENNFIVPTNKVAGPLVKVHIVNNNLAEAVNTYEQFAKEHKVTPLKQVLFTKLIESEDSISLQRVFHLCANIHGETSSFYNLAFAFAECGMIQHARNILETDRLERSALLLQQNCQFAFTQNKTELLKNLLEATRGLNHDRQPIYYYLLQSYQNENKVEDALDLWTQYQEDDVTPSEEFKRILYAFLKKNDIEPPVQLGTEAVLNKFHEWKQSNEQILSTKEPSYLLQDLLKHGLLNESNEIVFKMISEDKYPVQRVLKFYVEKLAALNDLKTLSKLKEQLKDKTKDRIQFEKYFIKAHLSADLGKEYLRSYEQNVDRATDVHAIKRLNVTTPRLGHLTLLKQYPDQLEKYTTIAEKCAEKGIYRPINVLWLYKCLKENNLTAGEKIWFKYFANQSTPKFMANFAERVLKEDNNETLLKQLKELMKETGVLVFHS